MAIDKDVLDQLLAGRDPQELFAKDGLLDELKKALSERMLSAELDDHLEREGAEGAINRRNGSSRKTMLTGTSKVTLDVPRDRAGTFDPKLIAKYQRRFPDFDDKIVSMYARGMTVREIRGHLEELYGIDVSPDLISTITDAVLETVAEWQGRSLDACYPLVFFDAIRVKIRDEGIVRNKPVPSMSRGRCTRAGHPARWHQGHSRHLDRADRGCEVLAARHERAQEPRRRRHPDRGRRRTEGVPRGDQRRVPRDDRPDPGLRRGRLCIVHLLRNSMSFASWMDRKPIAQALRSVYRAETAEAGLAALDAFEESHWGKRHPAIA